MLAAMWNGASQLDESATSTTTTTTGTTTTTEHVQQTTSSAEGSLENLFHWQDTVMREVGAWQLGSNGLRRVAQHSLLKHMYKYIVFNVSDWSFEYFCQLHFKSAGQLPPYIDTDIHTTNFCTKTHQ